MKMSSLCTRYFKALEFRSIKTTFHCSKTAFLDKDNSLSRFKVCPIAPFCRSDFSETSQEYTLLGKKKFFSRKSKIKALRVAVG